MADDANITHLPVRPAPRPVCTDPKLRVAGLLAGFASASASLHGNATLAAYSDRSGVWRESALRNLASVEDYARQLREALAPPPDGLRAQLEASVAALDEPEPPLPAA